MRHQAVFLLHRPEQEQIIISFRLSFFLLAGEATQMCVTVRHVTILVVEVVYVEQQRP